MDKEFLIRLFAAKLALEDRMGRSFEEAADRYAAILLAYSSKRECPLPSDPTFFALHGLSALKTSLEPSGSRQ
jgi:hypothetical protein